MLCAVLLPATALLAAPSADAKLVRGTVVHRNARARSFVLATAAGDLIPVHTGHSPALGRTVVASVRRLPNGTYRLTRMRHAGARRRHVLLRGVLTYVDRRNGSFTVSAEGVSMLVRAARNHAASAASSSLPPVGTKVSVAAVVGTEGVEADSVQDDGTDTGPIDLEGSVTAIDTATRTLTISADDEALSGKTITVTVPPTIEISTFTVGEEVELQVTLQPDGTYLLAGSSSDEGAKGAEDTADQQGEPTDAADAEDTSGAGDHEGATTNQPGIGSDQQGSIGSDQQGTTTDQQGVTGSDQQVTTSGQQELGAASGGSTSGGD